MKGCDDGTVGCENAPGALPELLAPALAKFRKQHPRVAVSVLVETSDVMLDLLERGEVDVVLGRPTEAHFEDEFDIVFSIGVIHHNKEPRRSSPRSHMGNLDPKMR